MRVPSLSRCLVPVWALGAVLAACQGRPEPEERGIAYYARELPTPWIEALQFPEQEFRGFAAEEGAHYLLLVESHLGFSYELDSIPHYERSARVLDPALERITRVLGEEYGFQNFHGRTLRMQALPSEQQRQLRILVQRAYAFDRADSLSHLERARGIAAIFEELEACDAPIARTHLAVRTAFHLAAADSSARQLEWYDRAVACGERLGEYRILCQALGMRGDLRERRGDEQGKLDDWLRASQIANEHRLSEQAGRLQEFLANHYEEQGRLALSRVLRREAAERCESFGGASTESRFYFGQLELHARMGCWEYVERDLQRSEAVVDHYRQWHDPSIHYRVETRVARLRARLLMSQHHTEAADRLFAEITETYARREGPHTIPVSLLAWVRAAHDAGAHASALRVARRGLEESDDPQARALFLLFEAWSCSEMGQWEECQRYLQRLEPLVQSLGGLPVAESLLHDALRLRVARRSEDAEHIRSTLVSSLRNMESRLRELDATEEGFLILRHTRALHDELHVLLEGRPDLEYRMELEWQKVHSLLGRSAVDGNGEPFVMDACAELVGSTLSGPVDSGRDSSGPESSGSLESVRGLRIVYCVGDDALERWCVREGRLSHDRIPIAAEELRDRVSEILESVAAPPAAVGDRGSGADPRGARPSRKTAQQLSALARLLLPESCFTSPPDSVTRLELLLDGPLKSIPFGILNLSEDGYEPLLGSFDPLSLHFEGEPHRLRESAGRGLLVADPAFTAGQLPGDVGLPRLEHAVGEARAIRDWAPQEFVLLEGEQATRSAIEQRWSKAPLLYFAAHVLRDPETPYLSYLPLAEEKEADATRGGDAYLDLYEIGTAKLGAEPLVVLSACSSGAPHVIRGTDSPGLGEAFLRAGAAEVIQTLWAVDDEAIARLLHDTMQGWLKEGIPAPDALQRARRTMATSGNYRHPFYWGGVVVSSRAP